ncbi:MAG: rhomboid family intramembrane serine protease [Planctomycetota bacterium]
MGSALRQAWQRSRGSISLLVVWVCAGMFLLVALLDLFGIADRRVAIPFLGLSWPGVFGRFWLHQFLTAPFLHAGVGHLLFNMLSLWMLGPSVEKALGRRRFIVLSVLCIACSFVGFLLLSWGSGNIALGCSGAIFGILVAQALYYPNSLISIFALFTMRMKHAVLLFGAVALYLTVTPGPGWHTHAAHLLGAVAALVYLRGKSNLRNARWWQALRGKLRGALAALKGKKNRPRT